MKTIIEWFLEVVLIIIHFPSNLLKPVIPLDKVNKHPTHPYPIILVERWFSRNVFHIFAKKYLEKKGFKVYSLNHTLLKGGFEDSAENLEHFINKHKLNNCILVGISGGATTCLEYLQNRNGWTNTHKFISIGGSLKGSPVAKAFPVTKSIRQLIPDSAFFKNLYKNGIKNEQNIITFRARMDNMVPSHYSHLATSQNNVVNVVGHNLLHTFWLPTYRKVAHYASKD